MAGDPLAYIDARSWIEGRVQRQQARFRDVAYARIGAARTAHPIGPMPHDDGSITLEPLCGIGYAGSSESKLRPVSRPHQHDLCRRPGCRDYTGPPRSAPGWHTQRCTRQLALDIPVVETSV